MKKVTTKQLKALPPIDKFEGDYRFLSNFYYPCYVSLDDEEFVSTENAYQAAKTLNKPDRKKFKLCTPYEAKKWGRELELRDDWEDVKLDIMEDLVRQKFQKTLLKRKLLATWPRELIEGNWWHDTFWGVCDGEGQNQLGKLLMKVRQEIFDGSKSKRTTV